MWHHEAFMSSLGIMQPYAGSLLEAFISSLEEQLRLLDDLRQQQDFPRLSRLGHSIKGGAGQMYCMELAALGEQLEHQAAQPDVAGMDVLLQKLQQMAHDDLRLIRSYLAGLSPVNDQA